MIDDVSPLVMAAKLLKERGAYTIYAMATHGLLSSNAPSIIENSCIDEVSQILSTYCTGIQYILYYPNLDYLYAKRFYYCTSAFANQFQIDQIKY